ncbi:MAG TPA: hypothetical protein VF103_16840 [Polyangiaceae bacterium]
MRYPIYSLLFVVAACSGNSLKVGDDESSGGSSGEGASSGKDVGGGHAGSTSRGGTGGTAGTSSQGAEAGEVGVGGGTGATSGVGAGGVGGSVSIGGYGGTGTGGTATTPPITSCTDEFPFAGEWRGSILDFYFEPMEDLRLSISAQGGAGGYVGTLTWGEGDPPPPATNPDVPPPGYDTSGTAGGGGRGGGAEPWAGFPYTVVRGAGCDSAFRVSISAWQTWDSWCDLQEPAFNDVDGTYACMIKGRGGSSDGTTCSVQDGNGNVLAEYPQWRCDLCGWGGNVCACTETECSYNPEPTHTFDLTLNATGDVLSGKDASCGDCTVRFTRVQ